MLGSISLLEKHPTLFSKVIKKGEEGAGRNLERAEP